MSLPCGVFMHSVHVLRSVRYLTITSLERSVVLLGATLVFSVTGSISTRDDPFNAPENSRATHVATAVRTTMSHGSLRTRLVSFSESRWLFRDRNIAELEAVGHHNGDKAAGVKCAVGIAVDDVVALSGVFLRLGVEVEHHRIRLDGALVLGAQ
jgi:hypothetical protein